MFPSCISLALYLSHSPEGILIRGAMTSSQTCLSRSLESLVRHSTSLSRWAPTPHPTCIFQCAATHGHCLNTFYCLFFYQIQNLGFFPVRDLQLNIEIPEMTKNGNQLLRVADFYIDQVGGVGRAGSTSTLIFNVSLFKGPCMNSRHRQHILFRHLDLLLWTSPYNSCPSIGHVSCLSFCLCVWERKPQACWEGYICNP